MNAAMLATRPLSATPRRFLWIGLGLSVLVHAAVLALRFAPPEPPLRTPPMSLEVVLLNLLTDDTTETPAALAQTAAAGGGTQDAGLPSSPLPASPESEAWAPPAAAEPGPDGGLSTASDRALLTQTRAPVTVDPGHDERSGAAAAFADDHDTTEADELVARLQQQYAAISQRLREDGQRPRRHYFAPSTSPWIFAEYVEQWRDAVEAIGNRHYPPQLQGRYYGSLQMTVLIRADGSLAGIEIDTPSIHPAINEAARAIVQRAAPFAPFPDAVRHEADILSITRTWHFENDALSTETP
ncbi:MAG: energy transducer TonB [Pigmentiphaga sp.]